MQTKAWEFPYHSGGTPISSLAVACHQQHVKRSFSGLCTCCPYIRKMEQKPMDARCGEYCGHMGRGAMGYCTEQVEHSTVKKPETNNLLEHEPFYLQNLMIVMNEYRAERTGFYIVRW